MKRYIFILTTCLAIVLNTGLTAQTFNFTYDAGGNMIQRQLQITPPIAPPGAKFGAPISKTDSTQVAPPLNFKLYPNPAQTYINLEGDLPEGITEAKVVVFTSTGQVVKEELYKGKLQQIDVSSLKNGLYVIDIQYSKTQRSTYRLIISN
jgi:hypothetical protein